MLTATPASGYVFKGWLGDECAGTTGPNCILTINANKKAEALFQSQTPWKDEQPEPSDSGIINDPTLQPGIERKAVVVVHGTAVDATGWPKDMALAICNTLNNPIIASGDIVENKVNLVCHTEDGWRVLVHDWRKKAAIFTNYLNTGRVVVNAQTVGEDLAPKLAVYKHIHLIGHSAGSNVIQTVTNRLKENASPPTIHETFLDAYDDFSRRSSYT